MGASTAEKVVTSVQHLEYAFANAFNTISKPKEKKVAVIKGNGELHDILMADFIKQVRENYFIGTFTLDSVAKNPTKAWLTSRNTTWPSSPNLPRRSLMPRSWCSTSSL
jgi:hypothetical protein